MVPALGCAIGYSALMAGWMQYYFLYPLKQEAWEMVGDVIFICVPCYMELVSRNTGVETLLVVVTVT